MLFMTKGMRLCEVQTPFIFRSTRHSNEDVKIYQIKIVLLA